MLIDRYYIPYSPQDYDFPIGYKEQIQSSTTKYHPYGKGNITVQDNNVYSDGDMFITDTPIPLMPVTMFKTNMFGGSWGYAYNFNILIIEQEFSLKQWNDYTINRKAEIFFRTTDRSFFNENTVKQARSEYQKNLCNFCQELKYYQLLCQEQYNQLKLIQDNYGINTQHNIPFIAQDLFNQTVKLCDEMISHKILFNDLSFKEYEKRFTNLFKQIDKLDFYYLAI